MTGRSLTPFEQEQLNEAHDVKALVKSHPEYQRQVALREAAKVFASTQWGKAVSPAERAAVAQYCVEVGADPFRHVTLFSGNIFLNAEFWMEKAAEVYPSSAYDEPEDIADNLAERKKWGIPAHATAAYKLRFWKDSARRDAGYQPDVVDVGYAPRTIAKSSRTGKQLDEVGIAEPHKTARTRGARRLLRQITPVISKKAEQFEQRLQTLHAQAHEIEQRQVAELGATPRAALQAPADPYATEPAGDSADVETLKDISLAVQDPELSEDEAEGFMDQVNAGVTQAQADDLLRQIRRLINDRRGENV